MTPRDKKSLGSVVLMAMLVSLGAGLALAQRPNFVVIFTDDQQFNALAANGNPLLSTPTMDRIARSGVRFTQARAVLPVCSPARAALLTGQYNSTNGVENLGQSIHPDSPRLASELRQAGYATGVTGKWHLGPALDQSALGFDYFATFDSNGSYYRGYDDLSDPSAPPKPSDQHIDSYSVERASDFIEQALAARKPFFLWHNTQTPHLNGRRAWDARPENLARYRIADIYAPGAGVNHLPANWDDSLEGKPPYYRSIRNRTLPRTDRRYQYDDPVRLAKHTSEYYAVVTELDDMLTPLMRQLHKTPDPARPGRKLIDNTYVVFLSDNGWLMGDHGMTSKSLPFDQSARVPMAIMGPGVDRGRVDDRQVMNIDVAPTLLALAGVSRPAGMQGESLASMLSDDGEGPGVRTVSIVEIWKKTFAGNKPILAGYDGRYEVIYTYEKEASRSPGFVEIYDTLQDPWELKNLSGAIEADARAREACLEIHAAIQRHRMDVLGIATHGFNATGEQR